MRTIHIPFHFTLFIFIVFHFILRLKARVSTLFAPLAYYFLFSINDNSSGRNWLNASRIIKHEIEYPIIDTQVCALLKSGCMH